MQLALAALKVKQELVVTGSGAVEAVKRFALNYYPQVVCLATESRLEFGLFKGRAAGEYPLYYLCKEGACMMPEEHINTIKARIALLET
jgi:hypothetical protein